MTRMRRLVVTLATSLLVLAPAIAATQPPTGGQAIDAAMAAEIDTVANEWLALNGAPSASIAIVLQGKLAYARAYGLARVQPALPASTTTRYPIYSVSKQFTAAAMLRLVDERRLSLDDAVARWFPDLGAGSQVTVRQLLDHTGGLRDYWPQDFVTPEMTQSATPQQILDRWARRPLDFEPGKDWQYSNTGYVLAGAIIEQVTGRPLIDFVQAELLQPAGITSAIDNATGWLPDGDVVPYTRHGTAAAYPAPPNGAGWMFGAGNLAMTPTDVARWNLTLMRRSLLSAESYAAMMKPTVVDGRDTAYGLGLDVVKEPIGLRVGHGGAGSGALADSRVWPDLQASIVVTTNNDWADPADLGRRIAFVVLPPTAAESRARSLLSGLQRGSVDRNAFTDAGNHYLTERAVRDLRDSLAPLGPLRLLRLGSESKRGGMITRVWQAQFRDGSAQVIERGYPDGALDQFLVLQVTR